jgi:hypothetical protein
MRAGRERFGQRGAGGKLRLQTASGAAADGLCRLARITFQSNFYGLLEIQVKVCNYQKDKQQHSDTG